MSLRLLLYYWHHRLWMRTSTWWYIMVLLLKKVMNTVSNWTDFTKCVGIFHLHQWDIAHYPFSRVSCFPWRGRESNGFNGYERDSLCRWERKSFRRNSDQRDLQCSKIFEMKSWVLFRRSLFSTFRWQPSYTLRLCNWNGVLIVLFATNAFVPPCHVQPYDIDIFSLL